MGAAGGVRDWVPELMTDTFRYANAIDARDRLLVTLQPPDSWFSALGILDSMTGRITRVSSDTGSDHHSAAWLPDGRILVARAGLRAAFGGFARIRRDHGDDRSILQPPLVWSIRIWSQ